MVDASLSCHISLPDVLVWNSYIRELFAFQLGHVQGPLGVMGIMCVQ